MLNQSGPVAAALALIFVPASADAAQPDYETVGQFYTACRAQAGKPNTLCEAYMEGAAETLAGFGNGGHPGGICGSGAKPGELSRLFVAWAPKNKHTWGLPRLAGVALALRERFPCRMN